MQISLYCLSIEMLIRVENVLTHHIAHLFSAAFLIRFTFCANIFFFEKKLSLYINPSKLFYICLISYATGRDMTFIRYEVAFDS